MAFYYYLRRQEDNNQDIETVDEVQKVIKQELLELSERMAALMITSQCAPSGINFMNDTWKKYPGVFEFINEHVDPE